MIATSCIRPMMVFVGMLVWCLVFAPRTAGGHRGLRGDHNNHHHFREVTIVAEDLVESTEEENVSETAIDEDACQGRPRNHSLTWGHNENWYRQCQLHLTQADTVAPTGQWTMAEFIDFLQLQTHVTFTEFKKLPLPFTMIFNELSCRACTHDHDNCCLGGKARIAPDTNVDDTTWMKSICHRVDDALDEVCQRQDLFRGEL